MNEPVREKPAVKPWYRSELVFFVGGSICIAFTLVLISMALYTSSGASLLDLSRPGYKSVQKEVSSKSQFEAFSSNGSVTKETIDQFQQLYQKQVKPVSNSSDFDTAALSDRSLNIDEPVE